MKNALCRLIGKAFNEAAPVEVEALFVLEEVVAVQVFHFETPLPKRAIPLHLPQYWGKCALIQFNSFKKLVHDITSVSVPSICHFCVLRPKDCEN